MNELSSDPLPALSIEYVEKLMGIKRAVETDEQRVIRLMKGGFEATVGMTFEKYCEIRKNLIENYPEKLI